MKRLRLSRGQSGLLLIGGVLVCLLTSCHMPDPTNPIYGDFRVNAAARQVSNGQSGA